MPTGYVVPFSSHKSPSVKHPGEQLNTRTSPVSYMWKLYYLIRLAFNNLSYELKLKIDLNPTIYQLSIFFALCFHKMASSIRINFRNIEDKKLWYSAPGKTSHAIDVSENTQLQRGETKYWRHMPQYKLHVLVVYYVPILCLLQLTWLTTGENNNICSWTF